MKNESKYKKNDNYIKHIVGLRARVGPTSTGPREPAFSILHYITIDSSVPLDNVENTFDIIMSGRQHAKNTFDISTQLIKCQNAVKAAYPWPHADRSTWSSLRNANPYSNLFFGNFFMLPSRTGCLQTNMTLTKICLGMQLIPVDRPTHNLRKS